MDIGEIILYVVMFIVALIVDLIFYTIGWYCYLYLHSLFPQLPNLEFIQFILGAFAIRFIWSILFGRNED